MTVLLPVANVEKPWGMDSLPAPFAASPGQRIGEVWFEPPAALDELLVKYIFTSEKLSVQVHPDDAQALAAGLGRQGKEECWLVIAAEPGACLGVGFKQEISQDEMRAAALDGTIEHLLEWYPVEVGAFFYIPANTVHAIGAGVALIEIQQNSDITYRLYDYGRARELHLDAGIAVARGTPHPQKHRFDLGPEETRSIVDGPLFRIDQVRGSPTDRHFSHYGDGNLLVIPRSEGVQVANEVCPPGSCAVAPSLAALKMRHDAICLLAQPCPDGDRQRP